MSAIATSTATLPSHRDATDARHDRRFRWLLTVTAVFVLVTLAGAALSMLWGGRSVLASEGLNFFLSSDWNPVENKYGALVPIYGTLVTACIAMLIAVPVSFGIAFFLTEVAPRWLRTPVSTAIELLAGIPSIIYGMWGFFVLMPVMRESLIPWMDEHIGPLPVIGALFQGPPLGAGMLTAGLIMAIMILPFITAMFVEVLESVPPMIKESAYGVGATTYEVYRNVSVPYGRTAMVGAVMLGLGRALGETMAVTFVIGNATRMSASLFAPGATIASTIANEFPEASTGSLKLQSLLELGFILFVISFIVLALSRLLVRSRLKG